LQHYVESLRQTTKYGEAFASHSPKDLIAKGYYKLTADGSASSEGSDKDNQKLSVERASEVKKLLAQILGLVGDAIGDGEMRALDTEKPRDRNVKLKLEKWIDIFRPEDENP